MEELRLSGPDLYHLMSSFFGDNGQADPSCRVKIRCPGNSMSPFIRSNSLLTIAPFKPAQHPKLGDIVVIALHRQKRIIIHRIIKTNHPIYLTKGDNTASPDGWFNRENIWGRVISIADENKIQYPNKIMDTLLAAVSRTGLLNSFILPSARRMKQTFK